MVGAMKKRVLLLTGSPGVGKTTVLMKTVNVLKERGFKVGGMISREVRENGIRTGFEILDFEDSSKRGWLAHVNQRNGPVVGRYRVNLGDLEVIGAKAIMHAVADCDVVAIDEIGPMELFSERFREAAGRALKSPKVVLAVVHWKVKDRLVNEAKNLKDAEIITVTPENSEHLSELLAEKVVGILKRRGGSEY